MLRVLQLTTLKAKLPLSGCVRTEHDRHKIKNVSQIVLCIVESSVGGCNDDQKTFAARRYGGMCADMNAAAGQLGNACICLRVLTVPPLDSPPTNRILREVLKKHWVIFDVMLNSSFVVHLCSEMRRGDYHTM